mmetsp:Transcript_53915/g.128419  ORF Transcript_53915/g.128419 Transcript_53915/m.128419 type:complete len:679 (-) Transcript_53915:61-2097(-)
MDGDITLNIYDVCGSVDAAIVDPVRRSVGNGRFHAGVEVFGDEWSYGFKQGGTGVFCTQPRGCLEHRFKEAVPIGVTRLSVEEVEHLIVELAQAWPGEHYDLHCRNSFHFSDNLCWRLGVGRIPDWVTNTMALEAVLAGSQCGAERRIQNNAPGHAPSLRPPLPRWQQPRHVGKASQTSPHPGPHPGKYPEACLVPSTACVPHPAEVPQVQTPPSDTSACAAAAEGRIGVGESVEICTRQWLPGHVESLNHDTMVVAFQWPGAAPGDFSKVQLPVGHRDVRRAAAIAPNQTTAFAPEPAGHLVGDWVEVFSNSHQAWCKGYVESSKGNNVVVAFRPQQAAPNDWLRKELPMDHEDLRWPKARGPVFSVGDWVEIYSNCEQVWCLGCVTKVTNNAVSVAFYVPGGDINTCAEKDVPIGSQDIRPVDVVPREARQLQGTATEDISKPYAAGAPSQTTQAFVNGSLANVDVSLQRLSRSRLDPDTFGEIVRVANLERQEALRLQANSRSSDIAGNAQNTTSTTELEFTPTNGVSFPTLGITSKTVTSARNFEAGSHSNGNAKSSSSSTEFGSGSASGGSLPTSCSTSHTSPSTGMRIITGQISEASGEDPAVSVGSVAHEAGACRPCSYFLASAVGCRNGTACRFCHLPHDRVSQRRPCKAKRDRHRKVVTGIEEWLGQNR